MEIVAVLLLLATTVGLFFLGLFFWAYRGEQFENIEAPAARMLLDPDDEDRAHSRRADPGEPKSGAR